MKAPRSCPEWWRVAWTGQAKVSIHIFGRGFQGTMSAVSSGSSQGSAEVREPEASQGSGSSHQSASAHYQGAGHDPGANQADFGANEWLVEELYQRYLADPGSVDRAWWSFFADYQPALGNGTGPQPVIKAPAGAGTAASRAAGPGTVQPQQAPPSAPGPHDAQATQARQAGQAPRTGPAPQAPQATAPAPPSTAPPTPPSPAQPTPPSPALSSPPSPPEGTEVSRLRGAAARTVTNMTASLGVPTATSVRAVPAKLLVDNRIVINNHLRRGRGGKVSFTHLIAYAVLAALDAMPEMNDAYTEENGKPAIAKPDHVNLGLAIDVHGADGGRQLLVPNIKAAEEMDFRQLWTAYEDVVRRARSGKLAVSDFTGTTVTITNPGTIGTVHSVPQADARPGLHHRHRGDGVPGRLPGSLRGDPGQAGDQQVGHAHLHLRPPDHPGRAVRGVPAEDPRAAARRGRLLRRHLRRAAHPVRAGPLGQGLPLGARGRRGQVRPGAGADPRLPGARPPDGRHQPARRQPAQASRPGHQPARADAVGPGARLPHRRLRRQEPDEAAGHPRRAA